MDERTPYRRMGGSSSGQDIIWQKIACVGLFQWASSFQSCGLCLPIDGSEDHKTHCFKNRQPCNAGAERLKAMSTIMDDQREDPF